MFSNIIQITIGVLITSHVALGNEERRKATAFLLGSFQGNVVRGKIIFSETDGGLHVLGNITGMPHDEFGFHIHEVGDVSDCDATLGHFDTGGMTHGGQHHEVRHVGDLSNVRFDENNTGVVDFVDHMMTLRGYNNILGRALVLHERRDDLGKGGHPDSLTTGNAGPRVACGVIGILEPIAPWNSAYSVAPSFVLLIVSFIMFVMKL